MTQNGVFELFYGISSLDLAEVGVNQNLLCCNILQKLYIWENPVSQDIC